MSHSPVPATSDAQAIHSIVHLVYSFDCGGLEKVIVNLINHSSDYPVKHIVVSLRPHHNMLEQIRVPVEFYCLDKPPGNDLGTHKRLFRLLRRLRPHAIQTYNFGTIEYHFTAFLAGVPVRVHSDHGRGGDDPKGLNRKNNWFRRCIAKFIDHYVVVAFDLFDWVTQDLKIAKSKVSLIFNGVSLQEFECNDRQIHKPFKFCTVGRADKVKNQRFLIESFVLACEREPEFNDVVLEIVGDGPEFAALNEQVNALAKDYGIELAGFQTDIPQRLKAADVFVLSSLYEAMPMTILESMASRLPVMCTKVGGIGRFLTDEEVWFVQSQDVEDMASTMINIRSQVDARRQKVEKGYQMVCEKYSLDAMVCRYMTIYGVSRPNNS